MPKTDKTHTELVPATEPQQPVVNTGSKPADNQTAISTIPKEDTSVATAPKPGALTMDDDFGRVSQSSLRDLPRLRYDAEGNLNLAGSAIEEMNVMFWGHVVKRANYGRAFDILRPSLPICASADGVNGVATLRRGEPVLFSREDREPVGEEKFSEIMENNQDHAIDEDSLYMLPGFAGTSNPLCSTCRYNVFGSVGGGRRGKRCGERKVALVSPATKNGDRWEVGETLLLLAVPPTKFKQLQGVEHKLMAEGASRITGAVVRITENWRLLARVSEVEDVPLIKNGSATVRDLARQLGAFSPGVNDRLAFDDFTVDLG